MSARYQAAVSSAVSSIVVKHTPNIIPPLLISIHGFCYVESLADVHNREVARVVLPLRVLCAEEFVHWGEISCWDALAARKWGSRDVGNCNHFMVADEQDGQRV